MAWGPGSSTAPGLSTKRWAWVGNPGYVWHGTARACPLCPANSYCLGGLGFACPFNTTSVAGSKVQTDCQCIAGFQCVLTQD